ncbi:MAG: hypothetical protein AVDCRST_MAG04-3163, partial [uncultured Acetobacteraceae bacterium]
EPLSRPSRPRRARGVRGAGRGHAERDRPGCRRAERGGAAGGPRDAGLGRLSRSGAEDRGRPDPHGRSARPGRGAATGARRGLWRSWPAQLRTRARARGRRAGGAHVPRHHHHRAELAARRPPASCPCGQGRRAGLRTDHGQRHPLRRARRVGVARRKGDAALERDLGARRMRPARRRADGVHPGSARHAGQDRHARRPAARL